MKKTTLNKEARLTRQAVKTIIDSIISLNNLNNEETYTKTLKDKNVIKIYNNDKSIVVKELVDKISGEKTSIYVRVNGIKVLAFYQSYKNKNVYTIKA